MESVAVTTMYLLGFQAGVVVISDYVQALPGCFLGAVR